MEYLIGVAAAVGIGLFATVIGFDRERSFYPVVLIVIALLYLLFAAIAGSTESLIAELLPALLFVTAAALGFRRTPWLVVAGLAGFLKSAPTALDLEDERPPLSGGASRAKQAREES